MRSRRWLIAAILPGCLSVNAAETSPGASPPFPEPILTDHAVAAFAVAHDAPIEQIEHSLETGAGQNGDTITALATLTEKKAQRQWLIRFRIATATEKELASAGRGVHTLKSHQSGRKHEFSATPSLALDIVTAGPFGSDKVPPTDWQPARALISPEFLSLGLDGTCRTLLKLEAQEKINLSSKGKAPSPIELSEAEERSIFGFAPAIGALFEGVQKTPGLREILWRVADKPSLWSLVKRGGRFDLGLSMDQPAYVGDAVTGFPPGMPVHRLGFTLEMNDQPLLICTLFVTSPRPPLLATAGIVRIIAEPPANKNKRLDIRVLAARR